MDASLKKASIEHSAKQIEGEYAFAGWIPTANGRLSFRHIGDTKHPSICKYANLLSENDRRVIIGAQSRNLSDLLFAPFAEKLSGRSGEFVFVVSCTSIDATAREAELLSGAVYIFLEPRWRSSVKASLLAHVGSLNALRIARPTNPGEVQRIFTIATKEVAETADVVVEMAFQRDGTIHLKEAKFRDNELLQKSNEYAQSIGVDFGRWNADQAYFFIRDLCHVHQHHSPDMDTILILQEAKEGAWRKNILYSLHHYIIKMRRGQSRSDMIRAIGVLAYARSFVAISHRAGILPLPKFNEDEIEASLRAKIEELALQKDTMTSQGLRALAYRSQLLSITALLVALFALALQPSIQKNPNMQSIAIFLSDKFPLFAVMLLVLLCIIYTLIGAGRWNYKARLFPFLKDLTIVSLLHRKTVGLVMITLSIILVSLALFIAIHHLS